MRILLAALFITISARATPINEIHIEGAGLTSDQVQTLKNIQILPGDEFDPARSTRAIEKYQEYFEGKGFPNVKIQDTFEKNGKASKSFLTYRFVLGDPQKLSKIEVVSKNSPISLELNKKIAEVTELKPDELLDRDRLKDIKRSIEVLLLSQSFIDSKVLDIQTELIANKSYKAVFNVDFGQRVVFLVSGNHHFSRNELAIVIDEQRQVGLGRDYITVLINRLTDFYIEHGFRSVRIFPYTFESYKNEPRKVVFEITEGPRVNIHDVLFDGQETISAKLLRDIFFENANDRIKAKIYNKPMVEQAAMQVIEELKKRGYLSLRNLSLLKLKISHPTM